MHLYDMEILESQCALQRRSWSFACWTHLRSAYVSPFIIRHLVTISNSGQGTRPWLSAQDSYQHKKLAFSKTKIRNCLESNCCYTFHVELSLCRVSWFLPQKLETQFWESWVKKKILLLMQHVHSFCLTVASRLQS